MCSFVLPVVFGDTSIPYVDITSIPYVDISVWLCFMCVGVLCIKTHTMVAGVTFKRTNLSLISF